ncbi:ribosomal protein L7/L12 [Synechococcus elongatus]|uniref:ribosomal protein L7/L12 n=1 Tax=Synechococcus elongatus TaxID=32046 RepID=UPI0030D4B14A
MTGFLLVIALIAIITVITIFFSRDRSSEQASNAWVATSTSLSDWATEQVRDLVLKNRKIEAIKLVRNETGMGLQESRELVEKIVFGSATQDNKSISHEASPDWAQELHELIDQKKLIEAIKLVRQELNLSLKDAKEYVEEIQRQQNQTS